MKPIIYTLTMSPAIDYKLQMDDILFNKTQWPSKASFEAGGKGVNVSIVLDEMGFENECVLTAGGSTKDMFVSLLGNKVRNLKIFETTSNVRVNLKIHSKSKSLEINDRTKPYNMEVIQKINQYLRKKVRSNDYIVLGGSPPTGIGVDIFNKVVDNVKTKNIVIDARSEYAIKFARVKPLLIKPNHQELEDLTSLKIVDEKKTIEGARKVLNMGYQIVLVSLDKKGSILVTNEVAHKLESLQLEVKEATGAGDSMVAGFLAAHSMNKSLEECHKWGVAAASATVSNYSLMNNEDFKNFLSKM